MKISILSSTILGFASMEAAAFTLNANTFRTSTSTNKNISPNGSTTALHLKASDILARARKAAGQPEEEEEPQMFTDEILDDMQQSLLTLERRIKDGPGCLSADDVRALDGQLSRIIVDLKDYIANGKGNDSSKPVMLAASVAATTATPTAAPVPAPAPAPAPVYSIDPSKEVLEKTSSFGFGLARDHGHHHEQDHAKHTVQQTDLHKFTRIHTQDPKRNSKILSFRNRTRQLEQKFESESKGLGLDLHRNKSFTKHGCDDNDDGNDDSSMLSPLTFFVSRTSTQQSRSSIADLKMKKMQMELARDRKRIRIPSVIFTSASNPILASSPSLELV